MKYAPDGMVYLSVNTPGIFMEFLLPENEEQDSLAQGKKRRRLEHIAEEYHAAIDRRTYERG